MKILILANHYNTLRIFRRELVTFLAREHEVALSIPPCDEENKKILESYGTRVVFTDFERRGKNPFGDVRLLSSYKKLVAEEKPDKVICYTVKCNIFGSMACKSKNVEHFVNITGLGTPIEKGGIMSKLVLALYRHALKKAKKVFFENEGDRNRMVEKKVVPAEKTFVLAGAGVNLDEFGFEPYPQWDGTTRFLFIGRIMQEKGVDELFAAIDRLHREGVRFEFDFIGWYEENYEQTVKRMEREGRIRFHGFFDDVRPFIKNCHCSVLPSWHEGMSNTLLESASMGRPLITTAVHGCMEAVEEGKSGFLFPAKNEDLLFEALLRFAELSAEEKAEMGRMGRRRMEDIFDKEKVVELTVAQLFES